MSTLAADSIVLSSLLWITVKASALLCIAALAQLLLLRRASAATRHIVWTLGISSMLLVPVVSMVLPPWPLVIRVAPRPAEPSPVAAPVDEVTEAADSTTQPALSSETVAGPARNPVVSRSMAIAGLYLIGVFGLLIRLMVQRWHARRFARSAARVRDAEWMRLLINCADRMGVVRPVRLLRSREHNGLNRAANEAATGLTDRLSARRARAHSHRRLPRLFRTVRKPTGARPDPAARTLHAGLHLPVAR